MVTVFAIAVVAAAVAGWMQTAPTALSGPAWPMAPTIAPAGFDAPPLTLHTAHRPGLMQWPPVATVVNALDPNTARRAIFVFALALSAWCALGLIHRQAALTATWTSSVVAVLVAAMIALQPAHGLAWWLGDRLVTVVANALALSYFALATTTIITRTTGRSAGVWRLPSVAGFFLLVVAVALDPATAFVVPAAWLWHRLQFSAGELGSTEARPVGPSVADFAVAGIAVAAVVTMAVVSASDGGTWPSVALGGIWAVVGATVAGQWPVYVPETEPITAILAAGAWIGAVALVVIGIKRPRSGWAVAGWGAAVLIGGRVLDAITARGVLADGIWLALPLTLLVVALVRHYFRSGADDATAAASATSAAAPMVSRMAVGIAGVVAVAVAVAVGFGVGVAQRRGITSPAEFFAALRPLNLAAKADAETSLNYAGVRWAEYRLRQAWETALDFQTAFEAIDDVEPVLAALPAPRTAGETATPIPGVNRVGVATLMAEAQWMATSWAKRLIDGRDGRTLPMAVAIPPDYVVPEPSVYRRGATARENAIPYAEFYAQQIAGFHAAWETARHELATSPEAIGLAGSVEAARKIWQLRWLALLSKLPDAVTPELAARCAAIGAALNLPDLTIPTVAVVPETSAANAAANAVNDGEPASDAGGKEGPMPLVAGANVKPTAAPVDWRELMARMARALAGLGREPMSGMAAVHAELLAVAGHTDLAGFLSSADALDRDAQLLLMAKLAFAEFNRGQAEADAQTAANGAVAGAPIRAEATAALDRCRGWLRELAELPMESNAFAGEARGYLNQRRRMDGRVVLGMTYQFGPDADARRQALDIYRDIVRDHPMRMVMAPGEESGTQRRVPICGSGEPDVRFLAAELYLHRRQFDFAAEAFADELKRDPNHLLARLDLGRLQYETARTAHDALVREYTEVYRALPFEQQLPEAETVPAAEARVRGGGTWVPVWELERAFFANRAFVEKLEKVSNLVTLAFDTDAVNPAIRGLYADLYFFRGDANRALGRIDLAELFMRRSYVAFPDSSTHINGASIGDKLGFFYAELWKQFLDDPQLMRTEAGREAVFDLLSRALRLSQYVRDQLYEFARKTIQQNEDEPDERLYPFYAIAAELYPEWAPARHWLGNYYEKRGEYLVAERELVAAITQLQEMGRTESITLMLELAQHYLKWATKRRDEAKTAAAEQNLAVATEKFQEAGDLCNKGIARAKEFLRFAPPNSRAMGWQTLALTYHEMFRIAEDVQRADDAWFFLNQAIAGYQEFLAPKDTDANMSALRNLMQRRIMMLRASHAPVERVRAAVADYEKWVPNPNPNILQVVSQIQVAEWVTEAVALLTAAEEPNHAAAKRLLDQAAALEPGNPQIHFRLGQIAEFEGDRREAEKRYRMASRFAGGEVLASYHLGLLLAGQVSRRYDAFEALREFGDKLDAQQQQQQTGSSTSQPLPLQLKLAQDDARRVMDRLRREAADAALAGFAALEAENFSEAIAQFELVFFTNPMAVGYRGGYWPLLVALLHEGRLERTVFWALRALRFDPITANHAEYQFILARAIFAAETRLPGVVDEWPFGEWRDAQRDMAVFFMRDLIEKWPDTPTADRAREFLATLTTTPTDGNGE